MTTPMLHAGLERLRHQVVFPAGEIGSSLVTWTGKGERETRSMPKERLPAERFPLRFPVNLYILQEAKRIVDGRVRVAWRYGIPNAKQLKGSIRIADGRLRASFEKCIMVEFAFV